MSVGKFCLLLNEAKVGKNDQVWFQAGSGDMPRYSKRTKGTCRVGRIEQP